MNTGLRRAFACSALYEAVALVLVAQAEAQQSTDSEVEEVIVTGVPRAGTTKLEASVSVSALDGEDVINLAPRSVAEVFRSLPGIRSESSGGGGNANLTIRGIPLATGGSKYMQIQEDGLPVLEFGDINFGNTDNFLRFDATVDRIESIRGGSGSTFASNSPGGIINLISKTGGGEMGSVGVSFGLDYDEFRTDFEYGGSLSDTVTYHIGGFFRDGEGVRDAAFNGDSGGQIKANVTKDLDDGFLRLYFKRLDDRVITYLPSAVLVNANGDYGPVGGYDASSQTTHSPQTNNITTFDQFGSPVARSVADGIESIVTAFGFEFEKSLADGITVNNRFRSSEISGGFISPFTDGFAGGTDTTANKGLALCTSASVGGVALNCAGGVVATINGQAADPNQLAYTNLLFDTEFDDLGLLANDLQIAREFDRVRVTGGVYYSNQSIDTSWNSWHTRMQTLQGGAAQNIEYVARNAGIDANGNVVDVVLADNGAVTQSFLAWDWDLEYVTMAPYLDVGFEIGENATLDLGVRRDSVEARGRRLDACCGGNTGVDLNGNGSIGQFTVVNGIITRLDSDALLENPAASSAGFISGGVRVLNETNAGVTNVNYDADKTSFSIGGAYLIGDDASIFARYSEGGRAIADRLTQVGGSLSPSGELSSTTDGYDDVTQLEIGYKHVADRWSLFLTYFDTEVEETNAELTSGLTFVREYAADGIELEGSIEVGSLFGIRGNATWTDATIAKDALNPIAVGRTPRRQADFIYTITPELRGSRFAVGLVLQGSTDFFLQDNNDLKQDGYNLAHLFANWNVTEELMAFVNLNNLTDEFVITEAEEGSAAVGSIIRARPLSGRSSMIGINYRF